MLVTSTSTHASTRVLFLPRSAKAQQLQYAIKCRPSNQNLGPTAKTWRRHERPQAHCCRPDAYSEDATDGGAPQNAPRVFMVPARPGAARLGTLDDLTAELDGARLLWRVCTFAVDGPPF